MASVSEQPAVNELRQEIALNCCEVVLKKQNAELILAILDTAGEAVLIYEGDVTGSFDKQMDILQNLLGKAVGCEIVLPVHER